LSFVFNFGLEYAIKRVQVDPNGLKLNGTHQRLVYSGDVNILEVSVHSMKDNAEALLMVRKENGLEINVDKTKYTVMSRDQNAGRSHSMKIDNRSFEGVDKFKYLGDNHDKSKLYSGRN